MDRERGSIMNDVPLPNDVTYDSPKTESESSMSINDAYHLDLKLLSLYTKQYKKYRLAEIT